MRVVGQEMAERTDPLLAVEVHILTGLPLA